MMTHVRSWITWLLTINTAEEAIRRRGRNVAIVSLSVIILVLLFLPLVLAREFLFTGFILSVVAPLIIYTGVIVLVRRGRVGLGALILVGSNLTVLFSILFTGNDVTTMPYFFTMSILIAGLCLRPWQIWITLVVIIGGLILTAFLMPTQPLQNQATVAILFGQCGLLILVAFLSFLGAQSTHNALIDADQSRDAVEQSARVLRETNINLESLVAQRTVALQEALTDAQVHAHEQARLLAEVEQQRTTINALSIPVIPLSAMTLIIPLVGVLDTARLAQLRELALHAIEQAKAHYLVLDITGVPLVDSQVASGLLAVVQAARLLGTRVIVVGIRPEVAQAIVSLGLQLNELWTTSDLQSAIRLLPATAR